MKRRLVAILAASTVAVAGLAQGAAADPVNARNGITVPLTCAGTPVEIAVIGNGDITPGHVIGSSQVLIPQSFDLTFIFTSPDGTTEVERFTPSRRNIHGDLVTCELDWTRQTPVGDIVGFGTLTGFFTSAPAGSA